MLGISVPPTPELTLADGLTLMPPRLEDAASYYAALRRNDQRLRSWLPKPALPSDGHEEQIEMTKLLSMMETGYLHAWLMVKDGSIVGSIGLGGISVEEARPGIAYWIDVEHEGMGLMARSLEPVVSWALGPRGLAQVEFQVATGNMRSHAVLRRLGLTPEGIRRSSLKLPDRVHDAVVYVASKSHWPPEHQSQLDSAIKVDDENLLRRLAPDDAPAVRALAAHNTGRLLRWLHWMPNQKVAKNHDRLVTALIERSLVSREVTYTVIHEGQLAGCVTLCEPDSDNASEVSFLLSKNSNGKYGVVGCVNVMLDFAFSQLDVSRVQIRSLATDQEHASIPKALGFQYECSLKNAGRSIDGYVDLEIYSMTATRWENR